MSVATDLLAIHRSEFFPWHVVKHLWPALVLADGVTPLKLVLAGASVAINTVLSLAGVLANTIGDVGLDRTASKPGLARGAQAAIRLGVPATWRILLAELGVALAGAIAISAALDSPVYLLVVVATVALTFAYNIEPVRLKRHGLWGFAAVVASLGVSPVVLAFLAVDADFSAAAWLLVAAIGMHSCYGLVLVELPDTANDTARAAGTPPTRYRPRTLLLVAIAMGAVAAALFFLGFAAVVAPAWAALAVSFYPIHLTGKIALLRAARTDSALVERVSRPRAFLRELSLFNLNFAVLCVPELVRLLGA